MYTDDDVDQLARTLRSDDVAHLPEEVRYRVYARRSERASMSYHKLRQHDWVRDGNRPPHPDDYPIDSKVIINGRERHNVYWSHKIACKSCICTCTITRYGRCCNAVHDPRLRDERSGLGMFGRLAYDYTSWMPNREPDTDEYRINKFIEYLNIARRNHGVPPVTPHPALMKSAQARADDLFENDYYDHMDLRGNMPPYPENLADAWTKPFPAFNGWARSRGHHDNMVAADRRVIGVGISKKAWVLHVAARA